MPKMAYTQKGAGVKRLEWFAGSKDELLAFPEAVRREMGYALYVAQSGGKHESAKLFKGYGSGIYEIVSSYNTNAYRAIYVACYEDAIYVICAFQKKSKTGIKTPRRNLAVIEDRLKRLRALLFN